MRNEIYSTVLIVKAAFSHMVERSWNVFLLCLPGLRTCMGRWDEPPPHSHIKYIFSKLLVCNAR